MKKLKKVIVTLLLAIIMAITGPAVYPVQNEIGTVEAASVKISNEKLTLVKGQSKTLKVSGTKKKVIWSSNKKNVATVSSSGKVTAKAKGTATITAKVGSSKVTCKVTVESPKLSKTTLTLIEKQTATLKLTGTKQKVTWSSSNKSIATVNNSVSPSNASDKTVTWTSSNTKVVTVDSNGNIKAIGVGTATVSAKAGNKSAGCNIVVIKDKALVAESYNILYNYIQANGGLNNKGDKLLTIKTTSQNEEHSWKFSYSQEEGMYQFVDIINDITTGHFVAYINMQVDPLNLNRVKVDFTCYLTPSFKTEAYINALTYNGISSVNFTITESPDDASIDVQAISNANLRNALKGWNEVLQNYVGIKMSDLGFDAL